MRSDFELAVQLDSAVDRLLWGDAIVAVEEDVPHELIPFVETFAALLEITREPARPEFRQALRARFIGEGPAVAGTGAGAALLGRVAAVVAATFVVGSAINPALARNLVQSVSDTMGEEIAGVVQDVLMTGRSDAASPSANGVERVSQESLTELAQAISDMTAGEPHAAVSDTAASGAVPPARHSGPPQFSGARAPVASIVPGAPPAQAPAHGVTPGGAALPGETGGTENGVANGASPGMHGSEEHAGQPVPQGTGGGGEGHGVSEPGNPPANGDNPPGNHGGAPSSDPPTSQGGDPPGSEADAPSNSPPVSQGSNPPGSQAGAPSNSPPPSPGGNPPGNDGNVQAANQEQPPGNHIHNPPGNPGGQAAAR